MDVGKRGVLGLLAVGVAVGAGLTGLTWHFALAAFAVGLTGLYFFGHDAKIQRVGQPNLREIVAKILNSTLCPVCEKKTDTRWNGQPDVCSECWNRLTP